MVREDDRIRQRSSHFTTNIPQTQKKKVYLIFTIDKKFRLVDGYWFAPCRKPASVKIFTI